MSNNNLTSRIEFRIDTDIKNELIDTANQCGLNLSDYLRNSVSTLVNKKEVLLSIVQDYQDLENQIELFMEETEIETLSNEKDEIIYHCDNCKDLAILLLKFTRKSNVYQSDFNTKKFGKALLKCGEILYLAVGSSSFYDTAMLRAIEYAYTNKIGAIEILAITRSEYETMTRSVLIADKIISKIADYHISLVGLDIMMLRIACVLYQNNQIRRMNTVYSFKTSLFWIYLNFSEEKAEKYYQLKKDRDYKNFKDRSFEIYKREYKAMYELNNLNRDKFRYVLIYLMNSRLTQEEKEELERKKKLKKNGK